MRLHYQVALTLALVVNSTACVPKLDVEWSAAELLKRPDPQKYPKASTVVLQRDVRLMVYAGRVDHPYWDAHHHVARAILNEGGLDAAEITIAVSPTNKIVNLRARTITPQGEVKDVETPQVLETKALTDPELGQYTELKVFRFPDAKVGSIIEYSYTIHSDTPLAWWHEEIASGAPVEKYTAEIWTTKVVSWWIKPYNIDVGFQKEQQGDYTRIHLELENLPGHVDDFGALPNAQRNPNWLFRVRGIDVDYGVRRFTADWANAMEQPGHGGIANDLYLDKEKYYAKAPVGVVTDGCADKQCIAERALEYVQKTTDYTGHGPLSKARLLTDVISSGTASQYEKAILLFHNLRESKVTARYAAVRSANRGKLDPDAMVPTSFDQYLIYLPAQDGLSQPVWLDPSCEECKVGQVRKSVLSGDEALVFWAEENKIKAQVTHAEFKPIEADEPTSSLSASTSEVKLSANGDAEVTLVMEERGRAAVQSALSTRTYTADQWKESAQKIVTSRASTGRIVSDSPAVFKKTTAKQSRTIGFTVPAYAAVDGDKLIVPLTLFSAPVDRAFVDEQRSEDIYFEDSTQREELLSFSIPPGYRILEQPNAEEAQTQIHALKFSSSVTPGANTISVQRVTQVRAGRYPASSYSDIRQVARAAGGVRQKNIILTKAPVEPPPPPPAPPEEAAPAPAPVAPTAVKPAAKPAVKPVDKK